MRTIDDALVVTLSAPDTHPVLLVKIELDTEIVRLTDAFIDLEFAGETYLATGGLVSIGQISESQDLIVSSLDVTLAGIQTDHIALLLTQNYLDKPLTVYFGALNQANELVSDPFVLFSGRIDEPNIDDTPNDTTTITVRAANAWVDFSRKTGRFFNDKTQQIFYPGDRGFEYCSQNRQNLVWGR